jgi:hypothetical protein
MHSGQTLFWKHRDPSKLAPVFLKTNRRALSHSWVGGRAAKSQYGQKKFPSAGYTRETTAKQRSACLLGRMVLSGASFRANFAAWASKLNVEMAESLEQNKEKLLPRSPAVVDVFE